MVVKIKKEIILIIICFFIVSGILIAGLWPFNFFQKNKVSWLHRENGILLNHNSIVYSKDYIQKSSFAEQEITIELILHPKYTSRYSFSTIISFFDPKNGYEDLIIAQWRAHLLILHRNAETRNIQKYDKIGKRYSLPSDNTVYITLTTNARHTTLYLNGEIHKEYPNFSLLPLAYDGSYQCIIGNSPSGTSHWTGIIKLLAVANRSLTPDQVKKNYLQWSKSSNIQVRNDHLAFYCFDEKEGVLIKNKLSPQYSLIIPPHIHGLRKEILSFPWHRFRFKRSFILDIVLNILGFIPFGFFIALVISENCRTSASRIYSWTLFSGLLISLVIELLQVFLLSRNSSILDFLLNIMGTFAGILVLHFVFLFNGPRYFAPKES